MLHKQDLVKEFELIVKQQIIDHNKLMTATNISLQDIKKTHQDILKKIDLNINYFRSKLKEIDIAKFNSDELRDKQYNEINRRLVFLSNYINTNIDYIKDIHNKDLEKFVYADDIINSNERQNEKLEDLRKYIEKVNSDLMLVENRQTNNLYVELDNLQKDISDEFKDKKKFIEKLENKIDIQKVDNAGLIRENEVLKKRVHILEKKVEKLFTLANKK